MALNLPEPSSPELLTRRPILIQYARKRHRSGCPIPPQPQNGTPPPPKKPKTTRDLPNLSECHACGFRLDINKVTHKSNRLELLCSEWRVVLLCKSCYTKVQKCGVCSYCFSGFTAGDGGFSCNGCRRRVHKGCYFESRDVSPWSYCGSGFGDAGFVCVDCWVPRNVVRGSRCGGNNGRMSNGKGKGKICGDLAGRLEKTSLNEVVKDANCDVVKKVAEVAEEKAGIAPRTVELPSNVLDLVVERDGDGGEGNHEVVVDGVELALRLHRSMNNSRRISGNSCSLSSSDLALPSLPKRNGDVSVSGDGDSDSCGKMKLHGNNIECENAEKYAAMGASVGASEQDSSEYDSSTDIDSQKDSQENDVCITKSDGTKISLKEGDESSLNKLIISGKDGSSVNVESHRKQDESVMRNHGTSNGNPDRFSIRYTKRKSDLKSSSCE